MGIYKQYNNLSVPVKASLWFIACFVIQRGLQFIGMPIFTRIMSQEDYGVYSVFFSWTNILCVISSLNIYSGVFNKAAVKYEDERDEYISRILQERKRSLYSRPWFPHQDLKGNLRNRPS